VIRHLTDDRRQETFPCLRTIWLCPAFALAMSTALAPRSLLAAPIPTIDTPDFTAPTIEVATDSTIPDAVTLADWIHQESFDALAELEPSPQRRGTIRVSVSGALYEYQVSITTIRESSADEATTSWSCECSNDDLLARIRTDVQAAAKALEDHASPSVATDVASSPPNPVVTPRRSSPLRDLQLRGKVGLGLMAGGCAGVLSGIVLMGVGVRTHELEDDSAKLVNHDYRVPGIPTLLVGVGLLTTGVTLLVLDRRSARLQRNLGWAPHAVADRQKVVIGLTTTF